MVISLNLTDEDADLESRFALPGLFVTDVTLRDKMSPTIFHSIRLSVDIDRVEDYSQSPLVPRVWVLNQTHSPYSLSQ